MAGARTDQVRCFFVTQQMLGGVCLALSGYWDGGVGVKRLALLLCLSRQMSAAHERKEVRTVSHWVSPSCYFLLRRFKVNPQCFGPRWKQCQERGKEVKSEIKLRFTATSVKQLHMKVERKQGWKIPLCLFVHLNEMALLKGLARRSPLRVSTNIHNEDNNTVIMILKAAS